MKSVPIFSSWGHLSALVFSPLMNCIVVVVSSQSLKLSEMGYKRGSGAR